MSKILILANHYNTLRIFRRELLVEIQKQGHELVVSIPNCDDENIQILESYGCRIIITEEMQRRGINPVKDMILLRRYLRILKTERPDKVLTYTIKPNIYGAMACKMHKVPHYVNITGLGSAFQGHGLMRKLVSFLYKISTNKAEKIFFENIGNRDVLLKANIVRKDQTVILPGAGVNLNKFYYCEFPQEKDTIVFLFVGRIMREKGIDELFYAIRKLKQEYNNLYFDFIGWYEDDYKDTIAEMEKKGFLRSHGFQSDVRPFIESAHCLLLPSYHEGMSNTLLEGAAMCRPLITSDIHGCKEAVIDGVTGYVAKVKNAEDLYKKMRLFIEMPYESKRLMGLAGRKHMEKEFDKNDVVKCTIESIGLGA